jgi:hypothetical protein
MLLYTNTGNPHLVRTGDEKFHGNIWATKFTERHFCNELSENFNGFCRALTFKLRDKGKISLKKGLIKGACFVICIYAPAP